MRYCKLQIACFIIVWYVIFIYIQDRKQYKDDSKDYFFRLLVKSGIWLSNRKKSRRNTTLCKNYGNCRCI